MYNLNVPIKAKDPPWFAVQMGSLADSVATKIRTIIDNTNFSAKKYAKVDLFDIFIFNNVKSDLKIILFLPNKAVLKVKVLSL